TPALPPLPLHDALPICGHDAATHVEAARPREPLAGHAPGAFGGRAARPYGVVVAEDQHVRALGRTEPRGEVGDPAHRVPCHLARSEEHTSELQSQSNLV